MTETSIPPGPMAGPGDWMDHNDSSQSGGEVGAERTGHAVIEGDDPLNLKVYSLGISFASPNPYHGRYPCGSLIYEGVWYYGTYCLLKTRREPLRFGDAENLPK